MLNFKRGDVFKEVGAEPIFVTLNSFIKKDGSVYMARGAGLGCLRRSPGIDLVFGDLIKKYGFLTTNSYNHKFHKYGVVYDPVTKMGAFQVKYHLNDAPDIKLIEYSAIMLAGVVRILNVPVHLNFPGLGNEQNNRSELYKFLEDCFRNVDVTLWRLENKE